jgi:replicative DNA helicase
MARGDAAYERCYSLEVAAFSDPLYSLLWSAIKALSARGASMDELHVAAEVKRLGAWQQVGDHSVLAAMADEVVTLANLRNDVEQVESMYLRRRALQVVQNGLDELQQGHVSANLALQGIVNESSQILAGKDRLRDLSFEQLAQQIRVNITNPQSATHGMLCGIDAFDKPGGLEKGTQTIIAARPGMGKTTMAINLAGGLALNSHSVGIISLEMLGVPLVQRWMARYADIELEYLRWNRLPHGDLSRYDKGVEMFHGRNVRFTETRGLTVEDIRMIALMWKSKFSLDVLFVDHLLLVAISEYHRRMTRAEVVGNMSFQLRNLAQEMDIAMVVLTQVGRSAEKDRTKDMTPRLHDLKESGAIEEHADTICFLYRPEYYKLDTFDNKEQTPAKNTVAVIREKDRQGKTDTFYQHCLMHKMLIGNYDANDTLYRPGYNYEASRSASKPAPPHWSNNSNPPGVPAHFKPYDHTNHGESRQDDDDAPTHPF